MLPCGNLRLFVRDILRNLQFWKCWPDSQVGLRAKEDMVCTMRFLKTIRSWSQDPIINIVTLLLNLAMLAFTVLAVIIALAAFHESKTSGAEQQKALEAS